MPVGSGIKSLPVVVVSVMPQTTEAPEGWTEIDTKFDQQLRAFQRRRDGLVVSVERGTGSKKFSVVTLPRNFQQDNQVIDHLGGANGKTDAMQVALGWMQENDRQ